jgi:hypothetical protein
MRGVTSNMDGCDSLTGRARSGASRRAVGFASGGVCGKSGCTDLAHSHWFPITHPSPRCFNSLPRPVIFWVFFFEVWKYMLGTVSGPEHQ